MIRNIQIRQNFSNRYNHAHTTIKTTKNPQSSHNSPSTAPLKFSVVNRSTTVEQDYGGCLLRFRKINHVLFYIEHVVSFRILYAFQITPTWIIILYFTAKSSASELYIYEMFLYRGGQGVGYTGATLYIMFSCDQCLRQILIHSF